MEKTANRLKQLRGQKHLTLQELSSFLSKEKEIYISPDSLAKYERGERKPKIDKLEALANFFKVPVSYLRGEAAVNRLKELRQSKGLTLDDIEKATGINRGTYSNYENGITEPKLQVWEKLADYFDVSVPYLLGFDDDSDCNITIKLDKDVIDRLTAINVDYLRELDWLVSRYPMARFELQWLENRYNLKLS